MAEVKPKGAPVFLEIPATGETITLPGVTSLSNDAELKAAADAWIAKNYKGPTLAAPVVARTPAAGESIVTANRQPELRAVTPTTLTGDIYGKLASGVANVAGLLPGFDERGAVQYGQDVVQNIESLLGLNAIETSIGDILVGRGTGTDYLTAGLTAAPFAGKPIAAGFRRVAPELSAAVSRLATGPGAVAQEIAAAVPKTALTPEMAAVATPVAPTPVVPETLVKAKPVETPATVTTPAFQNEIPAPLPEVNIARATVLKNGENSRANLKEWTPKLYRETSPQDLEVFLPTGNVDKNLKDTNLFFADTPDLALGQGQNKGILMEFDASGLSGRLNKSKPAWRLGVENASGSEFIANLNPTGKYRQNLTAVRVARDATFDKVTRERLPRALDKLEQQGWVKTETDQYTQYSRPQATALPEVPVAAAAIPEAAVAPQIKLPDVEGQAALAAMEQKGLTKPAAQLGVAEKVLKFETDYLTEAGLTRPENIPFKDFFFSHFEAGTLPRNRAIEIAKQAGIEPQELSELVRGTSQTLREAGQVLQRAKVFAAYVPKEAADIAAQGVSVPDTLSLWKRFGNVQRGALVANLATTMRNTIGSVIRQPIDIATSLTDTAITAALNPFRSDPVGTNALDAFAVITDRFKPAQNKKFYEQLRTYKPGISQELLATYSSDIARTTQTDKFSKVEKAIDMANVFNRVTETVTRNVMFPIYLRRQMTKGGLNFDEMISAGRANEIPQEMYERALKETMDYTYAGRPSKDTLAGRIGNRIIDTVEDLGPLGNSVAPFPRFMMAAIKFQYEYNPAAAVYRGLTPKNIAALKGGDAEALAKAVVGTGLLYSAYQYRTSENAGEKWYEGKRADGSIIDLRPYYPLAPYLLVADIYKRINNGENVDMAFAAKDILQGLTGAQFRAGTGLYVVDELFKDVQGAGNSEEAIKKVGSKWLADQGAMLLNPLQQFKDFYAQYNPEEAIYRDAKDSFAGTLFRAVPGAQRALGVPEGESPAMEGPMTTQDPALRQLLGATLRPAKNIVQSELDRLGFEQYEVGSRTGEPAIDRLINRDLGIIAERGIAPLLQSPEYQNLDITRQTAAIKEIYSKAREAAVTKFNAENPELALLRKYKTMKREEKSLLNDQVESSTGMTADTLLRQLSKAPLIKNQEQYDALPVGTQFTDPGDYKVYTKGE